MDLLPSSLAKFRKNPNRVRMNNKVSTPRLIDLDSNNIWSDCVLQDGKKFGYESMYIPPGVKKERLDNDVTARIHVDLGAEPQSLRACDYIKKEENQQRDGQLDISVVQDDHLIMIHQSKFLA